MDRNPLYFFYFSMLLAAVMVCGCSYHPASYEYYVGITGLENYTSDGPVEILIPMPLMDDESLFTDEQMLNSTSIRWEHSQWWPAIVDTEKGKMISLKTGGNTLTNAYLSMDSGTPPVRPLENRSEVLDSSLVAPYRPADNLSLVSYGNLSPAGASKTVWHNYTSYVYIDENLTPAPGKNHTLKVYSKFRFDSGNGKQTETAYAVLVNECLPEGAKGWMPITVRAYKYEGPIPD